MKKMIMFLFVIAAANILTGCVNTYKVQYEALPDLKINMGDDNTSYVANVDSYFIFVDKGANEDLLAFVKVNDFYNPAQITANNKNHPEKPVGNAKEQVTYKIPSDSLKPYKYTLDHGVSHGLLVVPFKYRTHDGELTGGSSVGYYVGYQKSLFGAMTTVLASVGLSPIATQDVNTKEIDNKWGLTGAAGIIWTLPADFQLGVVAGYDHLGGNDGRNWPYENNLWWSLAIGYNFTQ